MIFGHDDAIGQLYSAWAGGTLHHAWLLGGPRGVGKARFADMAAARILAEAAGPSVDLPGLQVPDDHPIKRLFEAGSHLDLRRLERLPKERGEGLARNISIAQVRSLGELFDLTPALSPWRVVIIDSADDMEPAAANALLKMLEEPPANCVFLLVAHAPGRLLPTIRSRCRRLDLQPLDDDAMTSVLRAELPSISDEERAKLISMASGSPGRAVALANLDLAPLEQLATSILREGDLTNSKRSRLASELGKKGAGERYEAFLALVPSIVAREVRQLHGEHRARALDAYDRTRDLAKVAPRLSLDPASTSFQIGGILAGIADPPA